MTDRPATPPAGAAPVGFTYQELWLRCEGEMNRCAAWVGVARAEGRQPDRHHVRGEVMFRQLCTLLDLIMTDEDLRRHVRDVSAARKAAEAREAATTAIDNGDDDDASA